jgi:hypothetical protein
MAPQAWIVPQVLPNVGKYSLQMPQVENPLHQPDPSLV